VQVSSRRVLVDRQLETDSSVRGQLKCEEVTDIRYTQSVYIRRKFVVEVRVGP
jgi:hypothetical protein